MNYKITLRIFSVIFILAGALFFILGPGVLCYFGVNAIPDVTMPDGDVSDFWRVYSFARAFGAAIVMFGILIGFLAYIEGEQNQKRVASGSALGVFVFLLILIAQQTAIWSTAAGCALTGLFIIAFIVFLLLTIRKSKPAENNN